MAIHIVDSVALPDAAYNFDPTYGRSLDDLLAIEPPEPPDGFDAFWRETFDINARSPLDYELKHVEYPDPAWTVYRADFKSWGDFRTGAWITHRTGGRINRGVVVGHGYGGREMPGGADVPVDDAAYIFPVARGFHISASSSLPKNNSSEHVVFGIETRETYLIRACVAEQWTAASVLLDAFPSIGSNLYYIGGSFGGGIGALMLPWDLRFIKAALAVPTFGHHPIRLTCPCVGSGESVRKYFQTHPEVIDVLKFYDAATAATRIKIPMALTAARFDPAVPPPGQFAVCNAVPCPKELFVVSMGHRDYPESAASAAQINAYLRNEFFVD
ncbi:MAG: acetylxylan esterase [Planctomycetota bacterium]